MNIATKITAGCLALMMVLFTPVAWAAPGVPDKGDFSQASETANSGTGPLMATEKPGFGDPSDSYSNDSDSSDNDDDNPRGAAGGDDFTKDIDSLRALAEALSLDCKDETNTAGAAMCASFCRADKVDFCALRERSIAASALAGAKPTVDIIRVQLEQTTSEHTKLIIRANKKIEAAKAELKQAQETLAQAHTTKGRQAKKDAEGALALAEDALKAAKDARKSLATASTELEYPEVARYFSRSQLHAKYNSGGLPTGADLAALALRTAVALGKLALDRAKQEAVIWALDQLSQRICSPKDQPVLEREANHFWLSNTCSFANQTVLQNGFGAGDDMLTNLVAALENDLRRLPGTAAGTLIGAGFWAESRNQGPEQMLGCSPTAAEVAQAAACKRTGQLRVAAADAVEGVVRGQDPFDEFKDFAQRMDQIQRDDPPAHLFHAPTMQVGLCAASLGVEFGIDNERALIPSAAKEKLGGGELETIVAALVHYPACWSLVGHGFTDLDELEEQRLAAKRGTGNDVERLSTIIRLHRWWAGQRVRLESSISTVRRLEARALHLHQELGLLQGKVATAEGSKAKAAMSTVLLATLDVAEQGIELADAIVLVFEGASADPEDLAELFPALASSKQPEQASHNEPTRESGSVAQSVPSLDFEAMHRALAAAKDVNLAARALLERDWASATVRTLTLLRRFEVQLELQSRSSSELSDLINRLSEYGGIFVAIIQAEDADALATVLADTANPPGGWRRKQVPGSFTLSIASHVGFQSGLELRAGQYGATYERGAPHFQAPTLTVPVGIDIAWGTRKRFSHGIFVPLIDPAAFLQYDISEGGRLPGPRPLTVLSPGFAYRMGIPTTPITVLLGYYYRPQLRTWEATVHGPGADAHQFTLSLAVDATLWNLVKRSSRKSTK